MDFTKRERFFGKNKTVLTKIDGKIGSMRSILYTKNVIRC